MSVFAERKDTKPMLTLLNGSSQQSRNLSNSTRNGIKRKIEVSKQKSAPIRIHQ
jgi:hypothetical protein